ncbi:MAG: hypothetical protein V4447_16645 [Pseudomonadota bacterium]
MKILFIAAVCAFSLLITGVALALNEKALHDSIWVSWMFAVSVIWQPFLFSFGIVGFGAWSLQRLYRNQE